MPLDFPLPEHCSLLQAALWVSRGQRPIPDEVFEALPLKLNAEEAAPEGPLRALLQALRSGAIPARAIWALATDVNDWPPQYGEQINIPHISWKWSRIDWQKSKINVSYAIGDLCNELSGSDDKNAAVLYSVLCESNDYGWLEFDFIQVDTGRLLPVFSGSQPDLISTHELHLQSYTPPYLAFMLQSCQKLGLSADRRVTKQEIETWIRENWPPALGRPSDSKIEYMSTFLRHPEDEKGGHYRPMRKT